MIGIYIEVEVKLNFKLLSQSLAGEFCLKRAIGKLLNYPAAALFLEAVKDRNQSKPGG